MSYVQPGRETAYEKYIADTPILMSVACNQGDAISVNSSGYGILADATDETKPAIGFASRTVSAADIAASYTAFTSSPATVQKNSPAYDRGLVTLRRRGVYRQSDGSAGTAQTPGARVYLAVAGTAGATTTLTQTTTNGTAVQVLGNVAIDGLGWIAEVGTMLKYQTAGNSVATF